MKTLSDFKRKLVVGAKLRVTFHGGPLVIRGNLGNTVMPQPEPQERTVSRVQTNAVAFLKADGKESWLTYPKAADFAVENDAAVIYQNGKKILTYEFI